MGRIFLRVVSTPWWLIFTASLYVVAAVFLPATSHSNDECPADSPPSAPLRPNKGWWRSTTCTWAIVDCPAEALYQDETAAVRLPVGCTAPAPRITYSPQEDVRMGQEFASSLAAQRFTESQLASAQASLASQSAKIIRMAGENTAALIQANAQTQAAHERGGQLQSKLTSTYMWGAVVLTVTTVAAFFGGYAYASLH